MSQQPIALVTGAARGIGFGIAEELGRSGHHVVINDLAEDAAAAAAERLRAAGFAASHHVADITDAATIEPMLDAIEADRGTVSVLVNNAGVCPHIHAMEIDLATFRRTIDVNLVAPFALTQAVARRLIAAERGGRIVFITSLNEHHTNANQADYAASKGGLRMLMKAFSLALGRHGITCNAVAPGMILTDMSRHHWEQPGPAAAIKQRVPVGRIGNPTDIGRSVAFLVSPEAEYVSGISITTDGGYTAACN